MIAINDQMKELVDNALANGSPCILATVSGDGEPDIGYKGSMMVFDPESLAYWERTKRVHLKNVKREPARHRALPRRQNESGVAFSRHGNPA